MILFKSPVHRTLRGRLAVTLASLAMLCPSLATAEDAPASAEPRVLIQQTTELLVVRIFERRELYREDTAKLQKLVGRTIIPRLDIKRASIRVLGRFWRRASAEQRKRFTKEFQLHLVHKIATAMSELVDELPWQTPGASQVHAAFTYLPERWSEDGNEVTVLTQIRVSGDSRPIRMEYSLNRRHGSWKIHDIVVDGVSVIWVYGSSFASIARREGMDHLIEYLAGRNQRTGGNY